MVTNLRGEQVPERILERIQAMLNMTVMRGCTEAEALNAATRAQAMLFKYHLQLSQVQNAEVGDKKGTVSKDMFKAGERGEPMEWKHNLAFAVAQYNFGRALVSSNYVWFIGTPQDIQVIKELYFWLIEQAKVLADYAMKTSYREAKREAARENRYVNHRTYRNCFYLGFESKVASRLWEQWRVLRDETEQSKALVVVTGEELETYIHETFPKLGHMKEKYTGFDDAGYDAGRKAGATVSLTRQPRLE